MKALVLTSLSGINIDAVTDPFIFQGCALVIGESILPPELFNETIIRKAGELSTLPFINYPYFVTIVKIVDYKEFNTQLLRLKSSLNYFINFLWFVKDNSTSMASLLGHLQNTEIVNQITTIPFFNSKGNSQETTYNILELKEAAQFYEKILNISSETTAVVLEQSGDSRPTINQSVAHYRDYNEFTRIERALNFLSFARTNSFLPFKITAYISVLECLFTDDSSEVTHKVSERAAIYIGGASEIRLENFKKIKKAYGVRSKLLHGQLLMKNKDSRKSLEGTACEIDQILRIILRKVILQDSKVFLTAKLSDYFENLLFGVSKMDMK